MTTPKARFLTNKQNVKFILDVTASAEFQAAADAAYLELVSNMADVVDTNSGSALYHRMLGARQYRRMLETIGEAPKPLPPNYNNDNLQRNV